ncbi:MAG: hypothetical protein ACI9LG_003321, partial [Moritella dasanensis]
SFIGRLFLYPSLYSHFYSSFYIVSLNYLYRSADSSAIDITVT